MEYGLGQEEHLVGLQQLTTSTTMSDENSVPITRL